MFALFQVRCNNMMFSTLMSDLTTTWTSPSSSSRRLQADTLASCSSSQKRVEVLLSSWLVMRCLDSTVPFCWPCWHWADAPDQGGRGGNLANRQRSNKRWTSKLPPTAENNRRWVHGCFHEGTVCPWAGHRCLSADLWLCLCLAGSVWPANNWP